MSTIFILFYFLCAIKSSLDDIDDSDVFFSAPGFLKSSRNGPKEVSSCDKNQNPFSVAKCNEDQMVDVPFISPACLSTLRPQAAGL